MAEDASIDLQIAKATEVKIDEADVVRRVQSIIDKASRIVGEHKVDVLLKAITHIDLTSLKGNETTAEIQSLCKKAANAIKDNFTRDVPVCTAAVCIYPAYAFDAILTLTHLGATDKVSVACVAAGFPSGQFPLRDRLKEIRDTIALGGVDEVDVVVDRRLTTAHKWRELYYEVKEMRKACGKAKMKTILVVGVLSTFEEVYITSMVAMLAGSDFIKTSTGKEVVNATLPVGVVMCRAIRDFQKISGKKVGLKPAGGIKTAADTIQWMALIDAELGNEWMNKDLFRIGASSVLDDIVNTIHTFIGL